MSVQSANQKLQIPPCCQIGCGVRWVVVHRVCSDHMQRWFPSDGSCSGESAGVWMLTMETAHDLWGGTTWSKVFSRSDVWGSFKCSAKLNGDIATYTTLSQKMWSSAMAPYTGSITIGRLWWSAFAMDIRTEPTWRWHFVKVLNRRLRIFSGWPLKQQ
jgi:hypothetical protein